MGMAEFCGKEESDELGEEVLRGVEIVRLIGDVRTVPDAPHIEGRPLRPEKIDDDPLPDEHAYPRLLPVDKFYHLLALLRCKHRLLAPVLGDGDDHLVEKGKALFDRIGVSDGKGVERACKDALFQCFLLLKKNIFTLPFMTLWKFYDSICSSGDKNAKIN